MTNVIHLSTIALATITSLISLALFLWSQSTLSLVSLMISSSTVILSYTLAFLVVAHYEKTQRTIFKVYCCNMFNFAMSIVYTLVVVSFLLTFCSIVYTFVQDSITQYILYSVYGFVFLLIVIGSLGVASVKKPDYEAVDTDATLTI